MISVFMHGACGCCHRRVLVTRFSKVFSRMDVVAVAFGKCTVLRVYTPSFFHSSQGFPDTEASDRHFGRTSPSTLNVLFVVVGGIPCMWRSEDSCAVGSFSPGFWGSNSCYQACGDSVFLPTLHRSLFLFYFILFLKDRSQALDS